MSDKRNFREIVKENKSRILIISLVVIVMLVITALLLPFVFSLSKESARQDFKDYLDSLGWLGFLVMLGIQILQVVIAIIPGEVVELLAGMMYGAWVGLAVCLLGVIIGTYIAYKMTKFLGKPMLTSKKEDRQLTEFDFIKKEKKIEWIFFLLFFVPGTPKDLFNYVAPFTKIKFRNYLLIATFARIPSILTSTLIGASIIEGNYLLSIIVFAIVVFLGIIGVLFNKFFINKKKEVKINN